MTDRRVVRGAAILAATAVPWLALAAMSRRAGADDDDRIAPLFALALIATWLGVCAVAVAISRRPRLAALRALAVTLGLAATVALAELPALLRRVHWALVFRQLAGEGTDYQSAYVLDAELVYRRIPGLRWTGRPESDIEEAYGLPRSLERPITFTYDRWGYRNAVEMERADVVFLGDSYVEGWYVSDAETVAARLGDRLGRPVANLGVAGYGTLQELVVLESDALARRPRVVVWVFFEGNDLYNDHSFENARLAGPPTAEDATPHSEGLTRRHGWRERSFALNALRRMRRLAHPLVPNRAPYWALLPRPGERPEPIYFFDYAGVAWTEFEEERWSIARAAFERGIDFARQHGIEPVLVYAPVKYRVFEGAIEIPAGSPLETWKPWTVLPRHFGVLCTQTATRCLDLTELFRDAVRQGRMPFPANDTHWSPEGHELVAAALEQRIRESAGW